MTDDPPAPDEILNIVRCNCSVTTKTPCSSSRCSCVAHGLKCVPACGNCRGTECCNSSSQNDEKLIDEEVEDNEEDRFGDENIFDLMQTFL